MRGGGGRGSGRPLTRAIGPGRKQTARSESDRFARAFRNDNDDVILERVREVAAELKVPSDLRAARARRPPV